MTAIKIQWRNKEETEATLAMGFFSDLRHIKIVRNDKLSLLRQTLLLVRSNCKTLMFVCLNTGTEAFRLVEFNSLNKYKAEHEW